MFRHGSLFSGIGGFDIAATWMGWQNIFSCERNPFCQTILQHYWPNTHHYDDIFRFSAAQYRGRVDIISGGFPCQPFSQAGKRKGKADDRYLFPEACRIITEARPQWIVLENVAGLFSILEPDSLSEMEIKAVELFVRTVTTKRTAPLSDSSEGLSEALFQRSVQQDMYYHSLKTARQSFCVFRLLPLTPRTKGTGSGLLPTPTATEIANTGTTVAQVQEGRELTDRKNDKGTGGQVSLTDFLIYYTLQAQSTTYKPAPENMPVSILERLIRALPGADQTGKTTFPAGKYGQLNPRFVAEMMGFPLNWTELPFLPGVLKA